MEKDKKLKNFIKTTIREFLNENIQSELKLDDLVGKKFYIEVGSGRESRVWDKDSLIKKISSVILHNLFDYEFYYNWTDVGGEYLQIFKKSTLEPMISKFDDTLNKYFEFENSRYGSDDRTLVFKDHANQSWIDSWFQTNKIIPDELKNDYYKYRQKYAGVTL